jgi:hypothetical protein
VERDRAGTILRYAHPSDRAERSLLMAGPAKGIKAPVDFKFDPNAVKRATKRLDEIIQKKRKERAALEER